MRLIYILWLQNFVASLYSPYFSRFHALMYKQSLKYLEKQSNSKYIILYYNAMLSFAFVTYMFKNNCNLMFLSQCNCNVLKNLWYL